MEKGVFLFFLFFIYHFSFAQSWLWGEMGKGDVASFSNVSDKNGNCYLTGIFFPLDTLQFGSYKLIDSAISNGIYDIYIVKFDHYGNVIWAKQTININGNPYALTSAPCSISIDGSGNIYLNGNFPDTLLLGSLTLINNLLSTWSATTFIAKYDTNGNVIWAKEASVFNDSSGIVGKAISSDIYGNSYISGSFIDTIQFGTETITTPSTNLIYAFLAKYDLNGNLKWVRQSTGNTIYGATSLCVAADGFGNSLIGGGFDDSVTFGSYKLGSIPSEAEGDLFIAKYDSNGNVLWAKQAIIPSTYSGCQAIALTADKLGNVYLAGDFIDTITLDTYTLVGTSYNNFFVAKYDHNGNVVWAKQSEGLDNTNWASQEISIDNYNHIYLSSLGGNTASICKVVFGGDTLSINDTSVYDGVSLIFEIDSNGSVSCSSIILGGAYSNCIASDSSGNYVYFGGTTATTMVFGDDTLNPFSVPVNSTQGNNYFQFVARWGGCDSNIVTTVIPKKNIAEVKVYPNPNNGNFTLEYYLGNATGAYLTLYNTMGEIVGKYSLNDSQGKMSISNTGLSNGIYIWKVYTEKELIKFGKVIIIK